MNTINHNLIDAKYEVRGGIVLRAEELRKDMENGKLPFNSFVNWNIGNPQSLGQLPISFPREVNNIRLLIGTGLFILWIFFRKFFKRCNDTC